MKLLHFNLYFSLNWPKAMKMSIGCNDEIVTRPRAVLGRTDEIVTPRLMKM